MQKMSEGHRKEVMPPGFLLEVGHKNIHSSLAGARAWQPGLTCTEDLPNEVLHSNKAKDEYIWAFNS
jgi:hypothetical protein